MKGQEMYSVKVFARRNAVEIDNQVFDNRQDAEQYFVQTGIGESYWSELRNSQGVTLVSTAGVSGN